MGKALATEPGALSAIAGTPCGGRRELLCAALDLTQPEHCGAKACHTHVLNFLFKKEIIKFGDV